MQPQVAHSKQERASTGAVASDRLWQHELAPLAPVGTTSVTEFTTPPPAGASGVELPLLRSSQLLQT